MATHFLHEWIEERADNCARLGKLAPDAEAWADDEVAFRGTLLLLREGLADKQRLDYLDRDDIEVNPTTLDGEPSVQILRARDGNVLAEARTLRAAVDAALGAASPTGGEG